MRSILIVASLAVLSACSLKGGVGSGISFGKLGPTPESPASNADTSDNQGNSELNLKTAERKPNNPVSLDMHLLMEAGFNHFPIKLTGDILGSALYPSAGGNDFKRVIISEFLSGWIWNLPINKTRYLIRYSVGSGTAEGFNNYSNWDSILTRNQLFAFGWENRNIYTDKKSWFNSDPKKMSQSTRVEFFYFKRKFNFVEETSFGYSVTEHGIGLGVTWFIESAFIPSPFSSINIDIEPE